MTARSRSLITAAVAAGLGLTLAACGGEGGLGKIEERVAVSTSTGSTRAEIRTEVQAALDTLYSQRPGTRRLVEQSKAVLVFPKVTQAGIGPVGGLYGQGAMLRGGEVTGYYNIAGGNLGATLGAQTFSHGYVFNTEEALQTFRETQGIVAGANATLAAGNFGADAEITTATFQVPVVVMTWDQAGLMAGVSLEGAKITEINPES